MLSVQNSHKREKRQGSCAVTAVTGQNQAKRSSSSFFVPIKTLQKKGGLKNKKHALHFLPQVRFRSSANSKIPWKKAWTVMSTFGRLPSHNSMGQIWPHFLWACCPLGLADGSFWSISSSSDLYQVSLSFSMHSHTCTFGPFVFCLLFS